MIWLEPLLDFLLPAPCLACRRLRPAREGALGLCPGCFSRLEPTKAGCLTCGRPLAAAPLPAGWRCGSCREAPPPFERLISLWSYRPPLDSVLLGLKFGRLDYLAVELGEALAAELVLRGLGADQVVPVPLHWFRRLRRGYDQAAAISASLARRVGLPLEPALVRRRRTRPQSALDRRERLLNPRGAFRARCPSRVAGKSLLLVDDVITTGATLAAAAAELKRAGARSVMAVAVARAPEEKVTPPWGSRALRPSR